MNQRSPISSSATKPATTGSATQRFKQHLKAALGFTLIEMMVSLAIGSITITVGVTAVSAIHRKTMSIARTVEVEDMAKVLAEYMVAESQGVGGGFIRPWASVAVVENDAQSDELYLFQLDGNNACGVAGQSGQTLAITNDDGTCSCLASGGWVNRDVIIMSGNDNEWATAKVTNVNTSSCRLTFNRGSSSSNASFNATFEDSGSGGNGDWAGGGVAMINIVKYRVKSSTHELVRKINDGAEEVLAPGVYDLQVAMGWDGNPQDGICVQNNSTTDEWIGNNAGDANNTRAPNDPDNASGGLKKPAGTEYKDLRQLEIGLIVGVKAGRTQSAQILDGSTKQETGIYMKGVVSRSTFRNSNIYQ